MKKKMISVLLSAFLLCGSLIACTVEGGTVAGSGTDSAFSTNSEPEPPAPTGTFPVTLNDPEHYVTGMLQSAESTSHAITELLPVTPGTVLTFYTNVYEDAELWMYVNGEFRCYPQSAVQNDQPAWKFTFCMFAEPATVEFRLQNSYVTVRELVSAAAELTAETVVQIVYETGFYGVAPENVSKQETTSFAPDDIATALQALNTPMLPISTEQAQISGGGYTQYTYYTTAGKAYTLRISNKTVQIDGQHYRYCR